MTLLWLIVYAIDPGSNPVVFDPSLNNWAIWLLICIGLDLAGSATS